MIKNFVIVVEERTKVTFIFLTKDPFKKKRDD